MMNAAKVILASQSPRRRELMHFLFEKFEIRVSDADETLPAGIAPGSAVEMLALRKAHAVSLGSPDTLIVAADTVVAIDGRILGKPTDPEDAAAMLRCLSGRVHQVYTGVALLYGEQIENFHVQTAVTFMNLTEPEISWYLSTGEPFDKAGAYGIQGYGARFIRGVEGDYFNVMGLPINRIYEKLGRISK